MPSEGWVDKGNGYWLKHGYGGRTGMVSKSPSMGWDASVRYVDGPTVRAPRYYQSKASAMAWADREMLRGSNR